jgi:hypothetical protein
MTESQSKLTTGRFKLPDSLTKNAQRMQFIGDDLLVYTENLPELTSVLEQLGFTIVEREYKLHVSANNEEIFKSVFGEVKSESRTSDAGKFIATVTLDSKEEYNKFLELGNDQSNGCRIKPFKFRFTPRNRETSPDNSSQYQRQPERGLGKGGKGKGGKGKGGKGKGDR